MPEGLGISKKKTFGTQGNLGMETKKTVGLLATRVERTVGWR